MAIAITAATVGKFLLQAIIVAGVQQGANYLIEKFRDKDKKGDDNGGIASLQELRAATGEFPMAHVLGRERLKPNDYLTAFIAKGDLGNGRRSLDHIHVLSEGPCEGVEAIWIDGFLAMEAPKDKDGNYILNGDIQFLEPDGTGWQDEYNRLTAEYLPLVGAPNDGNERTRRASLMALADLDEMDRFRFRAIQRVRRQDGGNIPGSIKADNHGPTRTDVFVGDWGSWCRAWVYPVDGFRNKAGNVVLTHQDSSKLSENPKWKQADYQFRGKCIVHLQLERSNFDSPFSSVVPRVEYQIKGRRITWPGQTTAVWTENTAAVRYWFETELQEIPPSKIDTTEFTEAYNKCEERITLTVPEDTENEYTQNVRRYSTNMQFLHDPSLFEQYMEDQDMAWQGAVVDNLGTLYFRPGFERAPSFTVGPHNIVRDGTGEFTASPPINDRLNAINVTLTSSIDHDFEAIALGPEIDTAAEAKDGRYLERRLTQLRAIKYPVNAYNIMRTFLLRARNNGHLPIRIQVSPTDFEGNTYKTIIPFDRCPVTHPVLGLNGNMFEVDRKIREDDWTVTLDLKESPNGMFTDQGKLPPLKSRQLAPPSQTDPATNPLNFTATGFAGIGDDGGLALRLTMSWTATDEGMEILVESMDGNFRTTAVAGPGDDRIEVPVPMKGQYLVSARHVNQFARRSSPQLRTVNVTTDHLIPPAPVRRSHEIRGDILVIFFRKYDAANFDVAGLDFRYRVRDTDSTADFPAAPTEDQWDSLPRFTGEAVIPQLAANDFSATIPVPINGRYRIYVRAVTRQGLISPIGDLKEFLLTGARPGIGTVDYEPDWEGTLSNVSQLWSDTYVDDGIEYDIEDSLVRSNNTVAQLSRNDWNGVNGWPFSYAATCTYTPPVIELPSTGNWNVRFVADYYTPPGKTASGSDTMSFQGQVDGVNAGSAVAGGDGSSFVRVSNSNEIQPVLTFASTNRALRALRILYFEVS